MFRFTLVVFPYNEDHADEGGLRMFYSAEIHGAQLIFWTRVSPLHPQLSLAEREGTLLAPSAANVLEQGVVKHVPKERA